MAKKKHTSSKKRQQAGAAKQPLSIGKRVAIIAAAVVVVAAVVVALAWRGVLAPPGAAAKYGAFNYISEQDVTAYIESYRTQQGYEEASDATWASFLASVDMTPESLREATVQQFVTEDLVEQVAAENGIEVSEEECEQTVSVLKESLAYGDDDIFEETLAEQGMTVEEFEDMMAFTLLEDAVLEEMVEVQEATDTETMYYLQTYYSSGTTTKHIYYFTLSLGEDDVDIDVQWDVTQIRQEFCDAGLTAENFTAIVEEYCDDDDLVARGGSNGYDIDISSYSESYQAYVETTDEGAVSDVYYDEDENCYAFIFIDDTYTLPAFDEGYELDDLPEVLQEYFRSCMSAVIWEDDCNSYLLDLYESSGCQVFAMPSGLSYDVDMSLAETDEDEDASDEDAGEDEDAEDANVEEDANE